VNTWRTFAVRLQVCKCFPRDSWPLAARFIAALCFSFLILITNGCKKKPAPPPPSEVQVITLATTNVPIFEEWIGTLDGYVNAQIHAQVTGYLLTQNYAEGREIKKGDLLFQIDPRPFQAELDQANAKLAQDKAQAGKTELDVKRYTPLAQEQAISQEQLDNAVQANLAANAQVKADEAAVENGQLNLGFTKITSPIDGLAGIALAQIGDLVGQSGGSVLTTVSTINPIKVYFQVSEQSYLTFWRRLIGSGNAGETFPFIPNQEHSPSPTGRSILTPAHCRSSGFFQTRIICCAPANTAACVR
jgi:membrane fusion protein (multidrug efflux system)